MTSRPDRDDPFTILRGADVPVAPADHFTRTLRARLDRGAALPRGVDMTVTMDEPRPPIVADDPVTHTVDRPGALPYLTVADGRAAIDWYVAHLGARLRGAPIVMDRVTNTRDTDGGDPTDGGVIGHAEIEIGGGVVYLAAAFPDAGLVAPTPGATSVSLMLAVDDTDRTLAAARDGGAIVQREPYEAHGSRTAVILDPFGHRWMLSGPVRTGDTDRVRRGDLVYPSLCVTDVGRAVEFYGVVLGWRYDAESRQVTNLGHRMGISDVGTPGSIFGVWAVDDIDAARAAIVAAGGADTTAPDGHPGSLDAVDDQGVPFAVYVPDRDEPRGEQHPSGHGELTYLTIQTPDSRRLRDFFGTVLGWEYTPGRVDDGWEVDDSRPQIGIAGGADEYSSVAMWTVDDIATALERVVAAGGRILSGPDGMPYATIADCVDDQGVRFYLGQY